jgi:HD-GYP domain-containing protein (c-di-GMP phosphodiesterase class II)/tetratricopeptide (TPR) repeat protein
MLSEEHTLANETGPVRVPRPRLARLLAETNAAPITVLVGPPGAGKSDVLQASLLGSPAVYFRVGNERQSLARFVHGLADALAPVAAGPQASFARAWERSLQSRSRATVLAHWLCEHLEGVHIRIIVDDLHDAAGDASVSSFLAALAELRPDARLTLAGRTLGALPTALWMATGRMVQPINETELRFDRAEIRAAAHAYGVVLPAETPRDILVATGGLPIAVSYALTQLRDAPRAFVAAATPASFAEIAADIFARRSEREQDFLFNAALLPCIEDDAMQLLGWSDPHATRAAMGGDAAFMWEPGPHGESYFHDRFRDYLMAEFQTRGAAFKSTIAFQTINSLSLVGRHAAALEVATRQRMTTAIDELLDAHGFEILESGEVEIVSEAIGAVAGSEQTIGASGLALRGFIEARSGHFDTAEAWFRLGLDKATDEASRVTIATYYARELGLRRREDACAVLESFALSTDLPKPVRSDVHSSFARALAVANRLDEARFHTDAALALLDTDSPPALRARVYARAAQVGLEIGEFALARERALDAVPLAITHGLYEVASSAYSVLYNLAYDIDDDAVASMDYLRCMRDMSVKSGALRVDLFVMLGMYELYAEAGDEAALGEMSDQLETIDKHNARDQVLEAVVRSKALCAGWHGNFDAAAQLLTPAVKHQATPARTAMCWAQIGLYRVAAADAARAGEAVEAAVVALASIEPYERQTTQYGLTVLTLALAALAGGDRQNAQHWLSTAGDAIIGRPRLSALHATLTAMIAGFDDAGIFTRAVPATLAALRVVSFGGMATLIEALPYPFAAPADAQTTVGGMLEDIELARRFAAAVAVGDTALLRAWLDTAHLPTRTQAPVATRFDRWVAQVGSDDPLTGAAIDRVRRDLRTYSRSAPAIIGLVDDIDAAIENLLTKLDIASPLMGEHSRTAAAWCSRLGRTLGLSESEITFVSRCGLIHDVGKMWTPAEILNAPRKLTPEEWVIMRAHAAEGSEIVASVESLHSFVPVVRHHHERLDGKGYPDGLLARDIPLVTRIVTVADCFHAMIGWRPYRPAMPPTEALNELERHRGTQFDAEIVAAMVQVVLGQIAEPGR